MRRQNPLASALMARIGMAQQERPRVKLECLRLLVTLRLDPARMRLISGFIDTLKQQFGRRPPPSVGWFCDGLCRVL